MRRRFLAALAGAALLGATGRAAAQRRPYRIVAVTWRGRTQAEQGFQDWFVQRGLPVDITWRDAAQQPARLAGFAHEIRELRPDLVYTWGTPVTLGLAGPYDAQDPARHVTEALFVFVMVAAPVGARLVKSLTGQERDVTGVYHVAALAPQLAAMRAYRRFSRLAVLYNAAEPNSLATIAELRMLAAQQGFTLLEQRFDTDTGGKPVPDGIEEKVGSLAADGAEWLYLGPDTYLFTHIRRVAEAALSARLPTFSATEAALSGPAPVLAGLVSSYYSVGQFAGQKAERILAGGERARDIPIETLTRYAFIVRLEVARRLDRLPPVTLFDHAVIR